MPATLFLIQLTATLFMTGLIWFVQIVHYPLFAAITPSELPRYARLHADRTGYIVAIPMLLELLAALSAIAPSLRPSFVSRGAAILSAVLVLFLWLTTAVLQIPLHNRLGRASEPALIHRLVLTNWIRTATWTSRSALLLASLRHLLS